MSSSEPITFMEVQMELSATQSVLSEPRSSGLGWTGNAILQPSKLTIEGGALSGIAPTPWPASVKHSLSDFNAPEGAFAARSTSWQNAPAVSRTDMLEFERRTTTELLKLSSAVDELRRSIDARGMLPEVEAPRPAWGSIGEADLAAADSGGLLASLFNFIADEEPRCSPAVSDAAETALRSDDAGLRAAAARVLALTAPERARPLLLEAANIEVNRVVLSIIRSAVRSLPG